MPGNTRQRPAQERPPVSLVTPTDKDRPSITTHNNSSKTPSEPTIPQPPPVPEQPRPAPSRRKRPIDFAYESMRSYTEPLQRQSFGNNSTNVPFLPPPQREPPPPPPKLPHPQWQSQPQAQRQAPSLIAKAQSYEHPVTSSKNHGKAKLNLLNPMSLLARRRSAQAVEEAYTQNQRTVGVQLPDPRIRGKVIHDFSAPRPGRPLSSEANPQVGHYLGWSEAKDRRPSSNSKFPSNPEGDSPSSTEKEHAPVFKENFDDSVESWSSELDSPAKRRSSAFLYQVALQTSQAPEPSSLPAFARNLPSNVSSNLSAARKTSTPPRYSLEVLMEPPLPNQTPAKSSPPLSPPKTRSRTTSITDSAFQGLGSPQRFKSNASRFSFDLAGVGSAAQERILEDKHRQKAKQKERQSVLSDDNEFEDEDGYADYDDADADDGLEERIPGVNADAEDGEMPVLRDSADNFNFISPNKSSFESVPSHASTGLTSPGTPRDGQGQLACLALSKSSPDLVGMQPEQRQAPGKEDNARPKSTPGAKSDTSFVTQTLQREVASETNLAGLPRRYDFQDDDDMYFDDGMIEDFDDEEHQAFDESVFDDDTSRVYGLPLRDLSPVPGPLTQDHPPTTYGTDLAPQNSVAYGQGGIVPALFVPSNDEDAVGEMKDSVNDLSQPRRAYPTNHVAGLTQDNLGLHDRLALAANQAALEGKFNRSYSQSSAHESCDGVNSLGTATQENQMNSLMNGLMLSQGIEDANDFAFDDDDNAFTEAEDDDPIIAAANAEALENDDEGFYGQEFGFFARKPSSSSSETEYANGGYFGPKAIESIHRMNSGRDHFQEPSLTPITERSEWSNRNSMISLMHGYPLSSQYQSNPQLADLMRVQEDEEMSLEALKKLRRGAWNGSSVSLQSSSNSQNGGSPLTYMPPGMVAPLMQQTNSNSSLMSPSPQNLAGSYHSFSSNGQTSSGDSNQSPSGESPTITLSTSQSGLMMPPMPMGPPPPPPTDTSPVKRSALTSKTWAPGHRRNSSGAESVSYREENGRWFCEKTRVIEETGEVEVLGRTIVEGGRI